MGNVKNEKRIPLSVPHMAGTEIALTKAAIESNWVTTLGPALDHLESEFSTLLGGGRCLGVNCGTSAIHLGLKLLDVRADDEVITPSLTFAASCNPILYQNAKPVFVDSDASTWCIDPNLLSELLKQKADKNRLPKAVIVVHLFGQSADMDSILEVCSKYDVPVLEDAAESLGSRYKGQHPGTLGQIGAFSFNGNKIITGSGGGMLVSKDSEAIKKARYWSTQSRDQDPMDIGNYMHSEVGYNYRLSNVLAALVQGQLNVLADRVEARRSVFRRYSEGFVGVDGIEAQPETLFGSDLTLHTRWLSCFKIEKNQFGMSATDLIRYLAKLKIEARPVWRPMHLQELFQDCEYYGGRVAESLNARGVCLPSSSSLSVEDQSIVIAAIREAGSTRSSGF
jgi:dTDP-4-amino-4,6-dideoxygalactose transaminase